MTTSSPKSDIISQLFAPPTRLAALLPDGHFFVRPVTVAADAAPEVVAEQVELALETLSPFPVAQLYHGHYWLPGSTRALVFAAYRKRFTPEEIAAWSDAEVVMPAFAVLLAAPAPAGAVRVLMSSDAIAVFHWGDDSAVPSQSIIHPLAPEASESERLAARDQLLRSIGAGGAVEEWAPPTLRSVTDGRQATFTSGENEVIVAPDLIATLDVRDKTELAERNALHSRDIMLWRVCLGLAGVMALCLVGEAAVWYSGSKVAARTAEVAKRANEVAAIEATKATSDEIARVTARRLLPLEMLNLVRQKRPENTVLLNAITKINVADNSYSLQANGTTTVPDEVAAFKAALDSIPDCTADIQTENQQQDTTRFTVLVTFAGEAVQPETPKPAAPAPAAAPQTPPAPAPAAKANS
jgi:hypothetical protein